MTSTWEELKFYGALAANQFVPAHDLHKIPGPPVTPGVGHIPHVMRPDYHVQMLEWANQYGGIYKFCLGCQWVVVVSDPAVASQVLGRGESSVPRKCIGYQFFDLATNHLGLRSFFTTPDEAQWGAVRKAAAPAFNLNNVRRVFPCVVKYAEIMAKEIALHPSQHLPPVQPAGPIDPAPPTQAATQQPAQSPAPSRKEAGAAAGSGAHEASCPSFSSGECSSSKGSGSGQALMSDLQQQQQQQQQHQNVWGWVTDFTAGVSGGFMDAVWSGVEAAKLHLLHVAGYFWLPRRWGGSASRAGDSKDGLACKLGEAGGDALSSSVQQGAPRDAGGIDIQHLLEETLLNVFVEGLFDIHAHDFPGHQVAAAMNLVLEEANERLKVPLRSLVTWITRPKDFAKVRQAQQMLGDTYGYMADVLRSRPLPSGDREKNLWVCLAKLKETQTGTPLSRERLVPEIGALMMAGFDTSSHTVAWCLYTLATHPEFQVEVRQELKQAGLLHVPGADPPRELQFDDLAKLPTLNSVIDETMRMFPVAATASVREVTKPTKVGKYMVPQGVIVWPMLYALHNADHNWEHPEQFLPQRWQSRHPNHSDRTEGEPSVAAQEASSNSKPKAFLPFSDGMKSCLGQSLGLMEVRTVLVTLLSRFHFELDHHTGAQEAVKMIMSLTLKMKGGLRVRCMPLGMLAADQAAPLPATTAPEAVLPAVTEGLVPLPVLLPAGGEAPPSAALTAASIQKSGDVICCEQELLSPQARTQVCEQQCGGEPQQEEHVKKKLTQPQPAERKPQLQGPFSHGSHLANLAKRSSSGMWGRFLV